MDIQIRTIREDEFEAFVRTTDLAFGEPSSAETIERERSLAELDRCFAAFDADTMVGTAGAFTMPMTVPGGEVQIGFVTAVGVRPTHTRRGVNTALMRHQLDDAHERGESVEVLTASEGSIYGRFGYGMATVELSTRADTQRMAFVRGYRPSGSMRLVEREDAVQEIVRIHEALRAGRPGAVQLTPERLLYGMHDHGEKRPWFFALHEGEGGVDGYIVYQRKSYWPENVPEDEVEVHALDGANAGAYADLWRFVFDLDLVTTVRGWLAVDDPLVYLVREPRRLRATVRDAAWVRLVDVPAALAARRYAAEGRMVVEVTDAFCPWNEGRFALEGGPDGAACVTSTEDPDLVVTVSELGAAYLGGASFARLHRAGLVTEVRSGALARADAMFVWDPAPWCPFMF